MRARTSTDDTSRATLRHRFRPLRDDESRPKPAPGCRQIIAPSRRVQRECGALLYLHRLRDCSGDGVSSEGGLLDLVSRPRAKWCPGMRASRSARVARCSDEQQREWHRDLSQTHSRQFELAHWIRMGDTRAGGGEHISCTFCSLLAQKILCM